MIYLIGIACAVTLGYQLTALIACIRHLARRSSASAYKPAVSVIKPVCGLDPGFEEALITHARQRYPEFEILCAVSDGNDAAIPAIERVARAYPDARIRIVPSTTPAANSKVGLLEDASRAARHAVLVVNDSDIAVPDGYLDSVVAPLEDDACGIVTCIYRARAGSLAAEWEALGIATDFAPSALVAPLVGVREFGLGSTLAFRAADLARIGGFAALSDYLADDYQLARHITLLGKRAELSETVVETSIDNDTWMGVWRHQVRWARTIRISRGDGYIGLPVTHSGVWALVALAAGYWPFAVAVAAVRIVTGFTAGWCVLRSKLVLRWWPLIPLWDVFAFAIWMAGLMGRHVEWRGQKLRLRADGRIHPV